MRRVSDERQKELWREIEDEAMRDFDDEFREFMRHCPNCQHELSLHVEIEKDFLCSHCYGVCGKVRG